MPLCLKDDRVIINILTIFPEPIKSYIKVGVLNQASKKQIVRFNIINIRDFSLDKHKKVDDMPYGGGPGMVMMAPVVVRALESIKEPSIKILLSPGGEVFNGKIASELEGKNLSLICGRYTGIDYRVRKFVDRVISVGETIVSGGELPALMIAEATVRLLPGVLGDSESLNEDKGYPVYTRPGEWRGLKVPEVLLSGNHKEINTFREQKARYDKNNRQTD